MSSHTETGLMKQTKKDLVGIILRKDAVEKELREKISSIEKEISVHTGALKLKETRIKELENLIDCLRKDKQIAVEQKEHLICDMQGMSKDLENKNKTIAALQEQIEYFDKKEATYNANIVELKKRNAENYSLAKSRALWLGISIVFVIILSILYIAK